MIYSVFFCLQLFFLLYSSGATDAITKIASQFKEDLPDMDNIHFLSN